MGLLRSMRQEADLTQRGFGGLVLGIHVLKVAEKPLTMEVDRLGLGSD